MKKPIKMKSLRETNSHLVDKEKYKRDLINNIISSSKIENINVSKSDLLKVKLVNF